MPDDLDQVTEEPAVEQTAEPTVDPAPEPEPEPEPAPESTYQPTFLDEEEPAQHVPQQQWSPEQIAAVQAQRAAQMQQQPPVNQRSEDMLNRFIQNPDGTISDLAAQTAHQVAGAMMAQQIAPVRQFISGQTQYFANQADNTIREMYDKRFNKDETFASSDAVKRGVDNTIRGLRQMAIAQAQQGDPSGFAAFSNPKFADTVLAMVKTMQGVKPGSTGAAPVPHTEATSPSAKPDSGIKLTADQKEAIRKYGMNEDEYIKTLEAEAAYNDFD